MYYSTGFEQILVLVERTDYSILTLYEHWKLYTVLFP